MGIFSSNKIPQPPLPDIALHLYCPTDKIFRPDELVSGHVSFTPVAPIAPHALEVSLFGQSLIWHRTTHSRSTGNTSSTDYHHWRDHAPLFEVITSVLPPWDPQAPALAVGQNYTYPFSFYFPNGTSNTRFGQYKDDSDELWTSGPHDLPPTFLSASKYSKDDGPNYAKVEYGVRVRLVCPGIGIVRGKNIEDLIIIAPVVFAPLKAIPYDPEIPMGLRHAQPFTLQTSALTGQSSSAIGFRQSMRDRFSSSTPKVDFELAVEIPDALTSGTEFRFRTSFNVIIKSENASHIPAVHFTVLKLDLKDLTFVRAPRDYEASTMMSGNHRKNKYQNMPPPNAPYSGSEHKDIKRQEVPLNALPASATIEFEEIPSGEKEAMEQARNCGVWFTARVPSSTPPSFRSFAISRAYQIKLIYGVEVGGKKYEHKVKSLVREVVVGPT
jgi:hypothetical protein